MVIICPRCDKKVLKDDTIIDKTTCLEHPDVILFFDCKFRCSQCGYNKEWLSKTVFDLCSRCEKDEHVYNELYQRYIDGERFMFKIKKVFGLNNQKMMTVEIKLLSDKSKFETIMTRKEVMNLYKRIGRFVPRVFFDEPEKSFIA